LASARSSRRNVELISSIVFGVYFLFIAITHFNAAAKRFEESQPLKNGLVTQANIIGIAEHQRGGTPVSVRFTDNKSRLRDSRTLVYFPEYLRVGQSVEISYHPDNSEWVRAPELGWSESEYAGWRWMSIIWIAGAISIFPLALWRRFRNTPHRPIPELSAADTEFKVKKSYLRLFLLWSVYAFALFVMYAIVTLSITHTLGLPVWMQKVAMLLWHALLAFKIGLPAVRVLFNDPITISRLGVSFYGRPTVPWADMSQILFAHGRKSALDGRLIISLKPSSSIAGYPTWQIPLRKLRPVVYLDLYSTQWDDYEIVTAMNHFGLKEHDPEAASRLLYSLSESGLIVGGATPDLTGAVDESAKIKSGKSGYMGGGFHFG